MKRKNIIAVALIISLIACENKSDVKRSDQFKLIENISINNNKYQKRVFKNSSYQIAERVKLPDSIGNIYGLVYNPDGIYISDKESIFRYKNGLFEKVFTPSKGRGPGEVPQIFRFDIINDSLIAIAGYPELRILIHDLSNGISNLVNTDYRGNVLFDRANNIYGENTNHSSSFMITKFNSSGDSLTSFGKFFNNQIRSLNMFDYYWDYNEKHDLIIIGFMYVGYYVAVNKNGQIEFVVPSIQHPGNMPILVNSGGTQYMDEEGKTILNWISTNNDETHIYTAPTMNKSKETYGALIDVINAKNGEYKFSYVLNEKLHWPILLLDDYSLVSITENYDLITWERINTE